MSDLLAANLASPQSNMQPGPITVASATTIAPSSLLTLVTGTINVATITPYVTGVHVLYLMFTDASPGDLVTTGNILVGTTTIAQNNVVQLIYNNKSNKYIPVA